jgi:MIP family channel proteins
VGDRSRRTAAEALGTFLLVLMGTGAAMVNVSTGGGIGTLGVSLAFAFVIIALVYALGHLSGAHVNPAVTIAFWSTGRFPGRDVGPYIVAQCTGAIAASALLRALLGPIGNLAATVPSLAPPVSVASAFVIEWLLSFALMFVITAVATDDRVIPGFAPIAIGLTVGFCVLMGGPLTGASMNPARSLGPALVGGELRAHWVYWVAPVTAMLVAVRIYDALRPASMPKPSPGAMLGLEGPVAQAPERQGRPS